MNTKIQNKKVLYAKGRIICNDYKLPVEELMQKVEHYLYMIKKLEEVQSIVINQEKLNFGIRFNLFNIDVTVGKLFELYNEIAEIEGLRVYDKIWYNPVKSRKFSPSQIG